MKNHPFNHTLCSVLAGNAAAQFQPAAPFKFLPAELK